MGLWFGSWHCDHMWLSQFVLPCRRSAACTTVAVQHDRRLHQRGFSLHGRCVCSAAAALPQHHSGVWDGWQVLDCLLCPLSTLWSSATCRCVVYVVWQRHRIYARMVEAQPAPLGTRFSAVSGLLLQQCALFCTKHTHVLLVSAGSISCSALAKLLWLPQGHVSKRYNLLDQIPNSPARCRGVFCTTETQYLWSLAV